MIEQEYREQQKIGEEVDERLVGATVAVLVVGIALLNACVALLWLLPW